MENGAQVDQLFNRNGFPPLMLASYDGYAEVVDVYWAVALSNINLQDKDGWSALLLASRQRHEVVNLLLDSMLKLTCRKMKGNPLACEEEHITWTVYSIDLFFSSATKVSLHYIIWSMLITSRY